MIPRDCERGVFMARVSAQRALCSEHFELTLAIEGFPDAIPGQFLQVQCRPPCAAPIERPQRPDDSPCANPCADRALPMLRRPFSLGGLRRAGTHIEIDIVARVVGPGTAWLDARRAGEPVNVIGPLGRGFSSPPPGRSALLVAGGVGLPPIRWLGETLCKQMVPCRAIFGARTRDLLPITLVAEPRGNGEFTPCLGGFSSHGLSAMITTDDGSCGLQGRVSDGLQRCLNRCADRDALFVYACGPEPMLRAVASLCRRYKVRCEVAMERMMACGMGTCQSCVVRVRDDSCAAGWRYALCCTEGPVFDAADVAWR
ncbi:MAG: dihydroorotate dehydrogenase electron transfer subunit [Phycisphaerae bacterium]